MDIIMATSITVTKKIPAGTATQLFTTGASESASMTLSIFGQQATANLDIKIVPSSYSIPQDRFDATNFTKTAHPGGVLDTTWTYISGDVVGGTTYNYLTNGSQYRIRDSTTNLFGTTGTFTEAQLNYYDNSRLRTLDDYSTTGGTISVRSYTAGALTKFTNKTSLTQVVTRSGFSYYGSGVSYGSSAGSPAITCNTSGTSYTPAMNGTTMYSHYFSNGNSPYYYIYANWSSSPTQVRMYQNGDNAYIVWRDSVNNWMCSHYATYTELASNSGNWNSTTNASYALTQPTSSTVGTTDYMVSAGYSWHTISFFTKVFLLFGSGGYTDNLSSGVNAALRNHILYITTPSSTKPTISHVYHSTPATYGYYVDATFKPVVLTSPDRIVFKCGAATGQTRYFSVDTAGTVADYGATAPVSGGTSGTLALSYNAKTLAQNYANYNQYKFTDGISDSDGLAYYTDGSGSYNTNGQSFWTKEGKYTLVRDNTLTKLNAVNTDDYWFDKQFAAAKGVRVDYTGVTLAPSQSFWITSPVDIQAAVFGFKE